jgi:hypothetical protein
VRDRAALDAARLLPRSLLLCLILLCLALLGGYADAAWAQLEATPPAQKPITSQLRRTPEERDRFEFGAAIPDGYFDVLGTFAYRRVLREGGPFEQSMQIEVTGGVQDYLSEGSLSLYYFLRPLMSYRQEWRIRPLLEIGPGTHLVIEVADLEGFTETSFHAEIYLKAHVYGGAEFLLTNKFGFLVRGRFSVPAHHPLDYAQAAIFLR